MSTDEIASKRIDIAIIEFNNTVKVVQDFLPISQVESVILEAKGCTIMGEAINIALDKLKERMSLYFSMGTPCYIPWIVMITDGCSTDDISEAAMRLKTQESKGSHGKLKFLSVGISGFDLDTLTELSNKPRILELSNYDYVSLFEWLGNSILGVQCYPTIQYELPSNVRAIRENEIPDE